MMAPGNIRKGTLKIYLGYARGVGKTYAMVQEGLRLKKRGMDVVVGFAEDHVPVETSTLLSSLERISPKIRSIEGRDLYEMNVTAIPKRNPQVVLVDELEHRNPKGAKNEYRYQDVLELIGYGMNIITTVNVQSLESVADRVSEAIQVPVQERIPDWILTHADEIVTVDVGMEELRERLRSGKIFDRAAAGMALQTFYTYDNLSFLRGVMMREASADQARRIEKQKLINSQTAGLAEEAVMVALCSEPRYAEVLLRKAARLANRFSTRCYGVHIQKSSKSLTEASPAVQKRVQRNSRLAKALGVEVETVSAENVAEALLTFASTHYVKHAVFGKPRQSPLMARVRGSLLMDFIQGSVGVDVHIVNTDWERKGDLTPHS